MLDRWISPQSSGQLTQFGKIFEIEKSFHFQQGHLETWVCSYMCETSEPNELTVTTIIKQYLTITFTTQDNIT